MHRGLMIGAVVLSVGCAHSTPCCDAITGSEGPFAAAEPTRLTFAAGANRWPAFSWDDRSISYRYQRGTGDRDLCAGLLPARGGQRIGDACAGELTEAGRTDVFMSLTPLVGDVVAFTRHSSTLGAVAPQAGGLYVGRLGAIGEARLVMPLLTTPPGGSVRYDFLMSPARTGPDQIIALAGQFIVGARVEFGPIDTVFHGKEIVKIDLDGTIAAITPLSSAEGAVAWAFDPASGFVYFHRPSYAAPTESAIYQVIADTIFRVSVAGGPSEAIWGRPSTVPFNGRTNEAIDGLGAGGGRVFISMHRDRPVPPPPANPTGTETRSTLAEITPGGATREFAILTAPTGSQLLWGRLAVSSDGDHLVAERREGGVNDLYLFDQP